LPTDIRVEKLQEGLKTRLIGKCIFFAHEVAQPTTGPRN